MIQITKNFTLEEFEHSDIANQFGIDNKIKPSDANIISNINYLCKNLLQPLRDEINMPIKITSGYRCSKLNSHDKIRGKPTSQHLKGEAADLWCSDLKLLYNTILELEFDQLIVYPNFVHVSLTKGINRQMIIYKSSMGDLTNK